MFILKICIIFAADKFNVQINSKMKHELKEVVAVVNNKGGVGKTTTVQSLAKAIVRRHPKYRVLCIDLDPQGNLSTLLGFDGNGRTMMDALKEYSPLEDNSGRVPVYKSQDGIFYAPASPLLQEADNVINHQMQPMQVLYGCFGAVVDDHTDESLGYVNDSFEYVLIDCPPALSRTTYNAMAVADSLLIPVQMEGLSVNGLGSILVEMTRVKKTVNKELEIKGIVPVMVDMRGNITKGFLDYLPKTYGDYVTKTFIHRSLKVNEAQSRCLDIFDYAPKSPAAVDYECLEKEIFK